MSRNLGAVFVGALVIGGAIGFAPEAGAWYFHQNSAACLADTSYFEPTPQGIVLQSASANIQFAACPGVARMVLDGGDTMYREDVTLLEVAWSIPSGTTARARTCVVDYFGTSGSCNSSYTSQAGPYNGPTGLSSSNRTYWKSGAPGGTYDPWDAPYIYVGLAGTNMTVRIASYYIEGDGT